MAALNLLKGAVMDILHLWLLKNTRQAVCQLNNYWHGALTIQHQWVFPPFCVHLSL